MSKFESVEVPFMLHGNQQILTAQQLEEQPWLKEFVERFKHCFRQDLNRDVWIYEPPESP